MLKTDVGYTGHVQDGSGLVYAQQRYYDPEIGRFMSTDPVKPGIGDPRYFGRYQYAANSPYRYTDPNGMELGSEDGKEYEDEQQAMTDRGHTTTSGHSTYEGSTSTSGLFGGDDTNDWVGYEDDFDSMIDGRSSALEDAVTAGTLAIGGHTAGRFSSWLAGKFGSWFGRLGLSQKKSGSIDALLSNYNVNDLNHLFGRPGIAQTALLNKYGTPKAALAEVQKAAQGIAKDYQTGTWATVNVGGIAVSIKGRVMDGGFRVKSIAKREF